MNRQFKKLFFGILSFPVFLISQCFPRSKKIWVFGSWHGTQFSDNTAYLFQYVINNNPNIKAVWLTENKLLIEQLKAKGYQVFHKNSIIGFWYGSRAGFSFINCGYDDVNKYCINRSFIVQLWHGIPLKKIKSDDNINETVNRTLILKLFRYIILKLFPFLNEKYNLIISSSPKVTEFFKSAFNISTNDIIETGFPRMDIIIKSECAYERALLYDEKIINKCILFAPTFRDSGRKTVNYIQSLDINRMNLFLKKNNAILLIKMHYIDHIKNHFINIKKYSNIKLLDKNKFNDINRVLYHVDLLITDYSSIFYDFLILDRPILFFPADLIEYQKDDRELYVDYNKATPGKKCESWSEIQIELEKYFQNEDHFKFERNLVYNNYYKYSDGKNCERIINTISNYL